MCAGVWDIPYFCYGLNRENLHTRKWPLLQYWSPYRTIFIHLALHLMCLIMSYIWYNSACFQYEGSIIVCEYLFSWFPNFFDIPCFWNSPKFTFSCVGPHSTVFHLIVVIFFVFLTRGHSHPVLEFSIFSWGAKLPLT